MKQLNFRKSNVMQIKIYNSYQISIENLVI
jgi:hypothetical protein